MSIDATELLKLFMLSLCIYREARGEPWLGKLAVGGVIKNRMKDPRWKNTYTDVILQPYQFSAFNRSDPQVNLYPKEIKDDAWAECVEAACEVMDKDDDFAKGANHYHTRQLATPHWAKGVEPVLIIDNHVFYKL